VRRRPPALTILVATTVAAATASGAAAQEPVFTDPLFKDRHAVDAAAPERIGSSYACSVVSAPSSQGGRLLILVTSEAGMQRARDVRLGLEAPSKAKVRVVDRRLRSLTMQNIRRTALRTRPRDAREIGIGEGKLYSDRCPRVEIGIPPAGEASPASLAWARGLLRRFGSDRVVVRHRGPTTL
jgi:hypothetical protein